MHFIMLLLFSFVVSLWYAFVFSKLWAWFVMTSFTSAPPLTPLQLYGLLMIIDMIKYKSANDDKNEDSDKIKKRAFTLLLERMFSALIALGIGALVHGLMR